MTSANADDRNRTLLNVSITKNNKALDAEPPIASLLKSRMIGGGPVNAAVRRQRAWDEVLADSRDLDGKFKHGWHPTVGSR